MIKFDPHPGKFETVQEACEYAYIQLLRQGRPSLAKIRGGAFVDDTCAYRGEENCRCFVGHIWPDSTYDRDLETTGFPSGNHVRSFVNGSTLQNRQERQKILLNLIADAIKEPLTGGDIFLISVFQSAHDQAMPYKDGTWTEDFKRRCSSLFDTLGWTPPRLNRQQVL